MADESDDIVLPEGLRLRPTEPLQTRFGKVRKCASLGYLEMFFLIIALLEIGVSLGFCVEKIVTTSTEDSVGSDQDLILAVVLTVNVAFCFFYIIGGVFTEKPYELIVFLIADAIVTLYVIGNYTYKCVEYESGASNNQTISNASDVPIPEYILGQDSASINYCIDDVKLSRLIVTVLLSPPAIIIGILVIRDYMDRGEYVFNVVGASGSLQTACKLLFAAISIIKLDLQLQISMLILIIHEDFAYIDLEESLVLSIGLPFSILWAIGSYISLRFENSKLLLVLALTSWIEPGYIVYRMYVAVDDIITSSSGQEHVLSVTTFLFGIGALLTRGLHAGLLFTCWRNFGRGLKEKVFS